MQMAYVVIKCFSLVSISSFLVMVYLGQRTLSCHLFPMGRNLKKNDNRDVSIPQLIEILQLDATLDCLIFNFQHWNTE